MKEGKTSQKTILFFSLLLLTISAKIFVEGEYIV